MHSTVRVALALALTAATLPAFGKTILPDACGDEKMKFDVSNKEVPMPSVAPSEGKARVFFVQKVERSGGLFLGNYTTRYGIDGVWVGANHGDSYFSAEVAPGEHHLCGNWQGKKESGALTFTAEAGKTYYFEAHITWRHRVNTVGGGFGTPGSMSYGSDEKSFALTTVSDDEGKFRVKAFKVSTWKKAG